MNTLACPTRHTISPSVRTQDALTFQDSAHDCRCDRTRPTPLPFHGDYARLSRSFPPHDPMQVDMPVALLPPAPPICVDGRTQQSQTSPVLLLHSVESAAAPNCTLAAAGEPRSRQALNDANTARVRNLEMAVKAALPLGRLKRRRAPRDCHHNLARSSPLLPDIDLSTVPPTAPSTRSKRKPKAKN
ncbi:hypothetical protein BJV77DRAFT_1161030 [Russula vinacea]|nr:hypothetical protein BJV77DRAFT_1161030 [Russula vinacea]